MDIKYVARNSPQILSFPAINDKLRSVAMECGMYTMTRMQSKEDYQGSVSFLSPVSTNNWDTVTIVRASALNDAIVKNKKYPKEISFKLEEDGETFEVNGHFYPWLITTGGDGRNVWFKVGFKDGSFKYTIEDKSRTVELDDKTEITISISLAFFPLPDPVAKNGTYDLSIDTVSDSQCINIVEIDAKGKMSDSVRSIFQSVMINWFNSDDTLQKFTPLFSTVVINNSDDKKFQWLRPTYMSYGYRDASNLDDALFGVLCMTNGRDGTEGVKQLPLVSMKKTDNIIFLISRELFVKYQYLSSLPLAISGTKEKDFILSENGLNISSENIKLEKVKYGSIEYQPKMKKFNVSFEEDKVSTKLQIDINISPGIDSHTYVETNHVFELSKNDKDEPIMVFKNLGEPIIKNEVETSPGIIITEVIVDIILAVCAAAISEAVEGVVKKVIVAVLAAIAAAIVDLVIHYIIESVVAEGAMGKLPSVTPMLEAAVAPVKWPFMQGQSFKVSNISYSGSFIFDGKEG